jgi:hypothetical protein
MSAPDRLVTRRRFLETSAAAAVLAGTPLRAAEADASPIELPADHRQAVERRRRRIVIQHDVHHVMLRYAKLHPNGGARFDRFRDAVFSYVDEPGSQIDAIWWDIAGAAPSAVYPSRVLAPVDDPLLVEWLRGGIDWVKELVNQTRRRKLEVFWNHRISEVDGRAGGGLEMEHQNPLKAAHPDWLVRSWWWQGLWNLAAAGVREHKVAILRELASQYDLDGIQIDFARHVPCLPVGRQWELREHVTQFLRMTRRMLLDVARQRGRPILLAARVPRNLEGCRVDGFDIRAWAEQRLVDVLTLGSRTMDVDVEAYREAVGRSVQLQPCFDDHHATDGYRYAPIELLRGAFSNHFHRGADSVVTFNWSIGVPELCRAVGGEVAPLTHQAAFKEVGDPKAMAGRDKIFALDRRGGYPWAEGFFNRNDTAPLPRLLANDGRPEELTLYIGQSPPATGSRLVLRCILFQAFASDTLDVRLNGTKLSPVASDAEWKDPQIFSPGPQPASGGSGQYAVNPRQRLLRVDYAVPHEAWRSGRNQVTIRVAARGTYPVASAIQLEKLEAHLHV